MILKGNNWEHTKWSKCRDKCRDQPYKYFICDIKIKARDRTNHMSEHYKNTDLYITCCSCKIHKHIFFLDLNQKKVYYVPTYRYIDFVKLKISLENILLNII